MQTSNISRSATSRVSAAWSTVASNVHPAQRVCESGFTGTYNGPVFGGENTFGGYSDKIVVKEKFVLRISHDANLAAVAPLLCAGITTYSPLRHWKVGPGKKWALSGSEGSATWASRSRTPWALMWCCSRHRPTSVKMACGWVPTKLLYPKMLHRWQPRPIAWISSSIQSQHRMIWMHFCPFSSVTAP
ncbi:Zinc-containing alcohol dehydrogenase superfamily protein [Pseudomonas amygdali pv. morsprunorum]|nr:Zinc-containing alcohol dehydrogenase superfamily protein [Pseudomonas amygdali pv. morsprunorum]